MAALLAACGGSQPPIGIPSTMVPAVSTQQLNSTTQQYRVLVSFGRYRDRRGRNPFAPLCYLNGTFYGTTAYGGKTNGIGVAFTVTPNDTIHTLHVFTAGPGGNEPYGGLTAVDGSFYGTTGEGGKYGYGAIFALRTSGEYRTLYSFNAKNPDGNGAPRGLLTNVDGTLYGTTLGGGVSGDGTVYSVSTQGKERILHYFNGSDGAIPAAGLLYGNGALYGTTTSGGVYNKGTVFRIDTSGREKVLFSFDGTNGEDPAAPLIAVNRKLYGTTTAGGSAGSGTVFSMTMTGKNETVLHNFGSEKADGVHPSAGLIDVNGRLYGTTTYGGIGSESKCYGMGCGIIFYVTTNGKERVLHRFQDGYKNDGGFPYATLIKANGRLYGTTFYGGYSNPKCQSLCYYGTIYEFSP